MYLYLFLSVIVICITFIICFILSNFTEISDYYKYKNDYFELKRLKDEYNENITKYQTQVESICDKIDRLRIFDDNYAKKDKNFVSLLFSLKEILYANTSDSNKIESFKHIIDGFNL